MYRSSLLYRSTRHIYKESESFYRNTKSRQKSRCLVTNRTRMICLNHTPRTDGTANTLVPATPLHLTSIYQMPSRKSTKFSKTDWIREESYLLFTDPFGNILLHLIFLFSQRKTKLTVQTFFRLLQISFIGSRNLFSLTFSVFSPQI